MFWDAARATRPTISQGERRRYEGLYTGFGGFKPATEKPKVEKHTLSPTSYNTKGDSRNGKEGSFDSAREDHILAKPSNSPRPSYGRDAHFTVAAASHNTSGLLRATAGLLPPDQQRLEREENNGSLQQEQFMAGDDAQGTEASDPSSRIEHTAEVRRPPATTQRTALK